MSYTRLTKEKWKGFHSYKKGTEIVFHQMSDVEEGGKRMCDENKITEKQKEEILNQFRKQGFRITKQRKLILDILLNHRFECKKAICYYVHQADPTVGNATVYRMLQVLEQMGVLCPENSYMVHLKEKEQEEKKCIVVMKSNKKIILSQSEWEEAVIESLEKKGYCNEEIEKVII